MRYLGGKSRIAKGITETILDNTQQRKFYLEPFVGGGAVAAKLGNNFDNCYYSDVHQDLMMLYAAIDNGWDPPRAFTEEEYKELRSAEPSPERALAGFAGSFGGKWFGGYARGNRPDGTPRDWIDESVRALLRDVPKMRGKDSTEFLCQDYKYFNDFVQKYADKTVIYCDPPYINTSKYSSTEVFDHDIFWETMSSWSATGASVFVSEYTAPDDIATLVWEKELRQQSSLVSQVRKMAVERLFMIK